MSTVKVRAVRFAFRRFLLRHLDEIVHPRFPVVLDYPLHIMTRYGEGRPPHPILAAQFEASRGDFSSLLHALAPYNAPMQRIPEAEPESGGARVPAWNNRYFSAMDAIALYGLLSGNPPATYMEVGSGHSTKFARRAVDDAQARTRIVSIDPQPRAEIDELCHSVIRQPLQDVPSSVFDQLAPGDVLFIDNSHRVFQNSDATVFFLDVLPRLSPGVRVHVHDIFLPYDYPSRWAKRYYSEQYLIAAWLLGGGARLRVLLPLAHATLDPSLSQLIDRYWPEAIFQRAFERYRVLTGGYAGTSFWFEVV